MIYNEHPGPWPVFLKRKDITGLPINEARKQYLIEQEGFNAGVSAAAASAVASSNGGLVRANRIAAQKGYKIKNEASTTTAVTRTSRQYEEFYYGKPADNKVNGDSGNPVWEIQLTKGNPADFPYGFCVWDDTEKRWFLTNDYTDGDSTGTSAFALGDVGGVNIWGTFTRVDGEGTLQISQGSPSAYPVVYHDAFGASIGEDNYIYKCYQTPITVNNLPVYFDCKNSVMIVFGNFKAGNDFGDLNLPVGAFVGEGWNMSETDGENIYTDIADLFGNADANTPYYQNVTGSNPGTSSTLLTDPSNPSGTFIQELAIAEGYPSPLIMSSNIDDFTITANIKIGAFGSTEYHEKVLLLSGSTINDRPCWQIDPLDAGRQDLLYWNNNNWILTQTSSLDTKFTLSNDPLSPDGDYPRSLMGNPNSRVSFVFDAP